MAYNELKNSQHINLTNKVNNDKKINQMRELLRDHIGKYKQAGMSEEDINEYLNLYI